MKTFFMKMPIVSSIIHWIYRKYLNTLKPFNGSKDYWEERYLSGGNSGDGSYNELAQFKAEIINTFVAHNNVRTIIEYGCGDGNQLKYAEYPTYTGFDVSSKAISICKKAFSNDLSKTFNLIDTYSNEVADLTLSLDVIYHLIEENVFSEYMHKLFDSSLQFVVIYASNTDVNTESFATHVKHRKFTTWVDSMKPEWRLIKYIPNKYPFDNNTGKGSYADFFIYKKAQLNELT